MKIKNASKVNQSKEITSQCVICGGNILVKVFPDGKYTGGNYFSSIDQAEKSGKATRLEYWECNKCFNSWEE
jgi:hypothetical protein